LSVPALGPEVEDLAFVTNLEGFFGAETLAALFVPDLQPLRFSDQTFGSFDPVRTFAWTVVFRKSLQVKGNNSMNL